MSAARRVRTTRWPARTLVLLASAALLVGCGVPTHTDVHVDGPFAGAEPIGDPDPLVPPGPDDASSPDDLVTYFLQAAAEDPDQAVERLREFVHKSEAESWDPDPQVLVVRVEDQFSTPGDRVRVRLDVRVVGSLSRGIVTPRDDSRSFDLEVVSESPGMSGDNLGDQARGPEYRIANPPDVIMLSDQALGGRTPNYLTPSPVYFWDSDHRVLVPDLRWLPTAFGATLRAQTKLEWLVDGPAPWLDPLATLPSGVALDSNVVLQRDDFLDVNLTPAAGDLDPELLHPQLWWTLRDEVGDDRTVRLTIDGQEHLIEPAVRANPSVAASSPDRFVLFDGRVVASDSATGPRLPPAAGEFDGEPHSAAVSRERHIALVHLEATGLYRLNLASMAGAVGTDLVATTMSRPTWLRHPGGAGLVAADGQLYAFQVDDPTPQEVSLPTLADPVTAITIAPDGRRAALIAGGRLYVTSLTRHDDGTVTAGQPRRLATTATNLAGVTFLQENWLAVIGEEGGQKLLYELTVDGAFEEELPYGTLGAPQTVTNMVGYPGSPLEERRISQRGEVMYEADGQAYRYRYLNQLVPIRAQDLPVELPDDDAPTSEPRAPFYSE
jgi:hypothetical protein